MLHQRGIGFADILCQYAVANLHAASTGTMAVTYRRLLIHAKCPAGDFDLISMALLPGMLAIFMCIFVVILVSCEHLVDVDTVL
jgi:hypothetical protein